MKLDHEPLGQHTVSKFNDRHRDREQTEWRTAYVHRHDASKFSVFTSNDGEVNAKKGKKKRREKRQREKKK